MNTEPVYLADTHCHIDMKDFDQDRDAVLERAREANVRRFLIPGVDLKSSRSAIRIAEANKDVYAAVGIHPHDASHWDDATREELRQLAHSPKVVAIGEIGLDYYRNLSPQDAQKKAFHDQLELAAELELPVILHNRDASEDLIEGILQRTEDLPDRLVGRRGVLHAFSANMETACAAMEAGFYLGIAGPITYPKSDKHRSLIANCPLERLILETDAPYLSPQSLRGRRNEPANIPLVAEEIALLFNMNLREVAERTSKNASNLFSWNNEG
jgi:TatD DNase family protein